MFIKITNMSHAVIMNFHYLHHDNNLIGITESITNLLCPVKNMPTTIIKRLSVWTGHVDCVDC